MKKEDGKKNIKTIFLIFSLVCFLAMVVCLIVDLTINQQITWGIYPLTAIPFALVATAPLFFAEKHKILYFLIILSLVIFPFLYFLQFVTPVHEWFMPLGLPLAIIGVGVLWITLFLLKFLKLNMWYLLAIIVFLYGVVTNIAVQYFVKKFVNENLLSVDLVINTVACIAVSILVVVIGYTKSKKNKDLKENQKQI